jgi:hypothetical protein
MSHIKQEADKDQPVRRMKNILFCLLISLPKLATLMTDIRVDAINYHN